MRTKLHYLLRTIALGMATIVLSSCASHEATKRIPTPSDGPGSQEMINPGPPPRATSTEVPRLEGAFGALTRALEVEHGFFASPSAWLRAQSQNCDQPLGEIPAYPSSANAALPTIGERNELALKVWGISIATGCPEKIEGLQLSADAFYAVRLGLPSLNEIGYLNPYDRLSSLGSFGLMAAKLEVDYQFGATPEAWLDIAEKNCMEMEGDEYSYWSFQKDGLPEEAWVRVWGASLFGTCRSKFPHYSRDAAERRAFWGAEAEIPISTEWGVAPARMTASFSPNSPGTSNPRSGSMVTCKDGWVSFSGGKQGACSWHGGVR